jgi:hypothetical protein
MRSLLTHSGGNPKTAKGRARGWSVSVLHLAPFTLSGRNVCADASPGCIAACLNTAGRGGIFRKGETTNAIQKARIERTILLRQKREEFVAHLSHEITLAQARVGREGFRLAVRLNGTSDLDWESLAPQLFADHPDVQFYDYTKSKRRALSANLPPNYDITFSRSEINGADCAEVLARGGRVAEVYGATAVIPTDAMPGDDDDLRFLDAPGRVSLTAKGRARKDRSGFVIW